MNRINIPKTDLYASTLALGTDYFGTTVGRDVCMELMDHYLEAGGNVIDTAESYASWVPGGEHQSEKVIGEWLRERGTRDQIVLSTKGRIQNANRWTFRAYRKRRFKRISIRASNASALIGSTFTGYIGTPQATLSKRSFSPLKDSVQAGKIKHAGFSNWTQSRAEEARLAAERLGVEGFVASQNMWSLAKPDVAQADPTWAFIDESFVRWHVKHGLSAFAYLGQARRLLSTPRAKHAGQGSAGCSRPTSL